MQFKVYTEIIPFISLLSNKLLISGELIDEMNEKGKIVEENKRYRRIITIKIFNYHIFSN